MFDNFMTYIFIIVMRNAFNYYLQEDIPDNEFDRKKIEDFVSFVVEGLLFYSYSFGKFINLFLQILCGSKHSSYVFFLIFVIARRCSILTRKFLEKNQFIDIVETVSDKLEDYPLLKILVLGAAILCIFPVGLFFMFAIVSLIITFALFLIIEGNPYYFILIQMILVVVLFI